MNRQKSDQALLYIKSYAHGHKELYLTTSSALSSSKNFVNLTDKVNINDEKSLKNEKDVLNRARKTVYDVAVSNHWDWFVTMTFSVNRTDYEEKYAQIRDELHQIKRYDKDFRFIFIAEGHEKLEQDGKHAIHFHGLISGLPEEELSNRYVNRLGTTYNWERMNKYGWNSMSAVRSQKACGSYLSKYMTKGLLKPAYHKSMYVLSRRLRRPDKSSYKIKSVYTDEVRRMLRIFSDVYLVSQYGTSYSFSECFLSDAEFFSQYGMNYIDST